MKCDFKRLALCGFFITPLVAQPGLGDVADNISPLIFFGSDMMQMLLSFLSFIFFVYSYSLWKHYRRNPAFTPLTAVITSFIVAITCALFAFMSTPSEDQYPVVISRAPEREPVIKRSQPFKSDNSKKQEDVFNSKRFFFRIVTS